MDIIENSAMYRGHVRHRRYSPKSHEFQYKLFMLYLDVDEIDSVCKQSLFWSVSHFNLVQYRRTDYLGDPAQTLKVAVINKVLEQTGQIFSGSVRMLTQLRYWGYCFNPVTFYFCFSKNEELEYIVSEINNTPWDERHAYVLNVKAEYPGVRNKLQFEFDKDFHVSPFLPMEMQYRWVFSFIGSELVIHMDCKQANKQAFDATLVLHRKALSNYKINTIPFRYALMCFKITGAIYWQALRLWLKRIPFYSNPTGSSS